MAWLFGMILHQLASRSLPVVAGVACSRPDAGVLHGPGACGRIVLNDCACLKPKMPGSGIPSTTAA